MRVLLLVGLTLLAGCQSIRSEAPDTRRRVEAAFADVVAAAMAPETDASTFARLVASRGGDADRPAAEALLADLRAVLADVRQADGRVRYDVEAYVDEPGGGVDGRVLTVAFARGGAEGGVVTVEAAFVGGPGGFLLGRLSR